MTELQLKIRRLAHRVSALKKANKDSSVLTTELSNLRAQRNEERSLEKRQKEAAKA